MSNDDVFKAVDGYIEELFVPSDAALERALQATDGAGMPPIQISASQGKFLHLLARLTGARRILEIGALGGYSTIWLGRALQPGGKLISLEVSPAHAAVARANLANAGLADCVEVLVGPALETLPRLLAQGGDPFDMVFIDADKNNYPGYLEFALKLTRSGGLIVADNVVRQGAILDAGSPDAAVQGIRRFNAALSVESAAESIVLQLVGAKGYDGMAITVVK